VSAIANGGLKIPISAVNILDGIAGRIGTNISHTLGSGTRRTGINAVYLKINGKQKIQKR
jgi:hypothetical protein